MFPSDVHHESDMNAESLQDIKCILQWSWCVTCRGPETWLQQSGSHGTKSTGTVNKFLYYFRWVCHSCIKIGRNDFELLSFLFGPAYMCTESSKFPPGKGRRLLDPGPLLTSTTEEKANVYGGVIYCRCRGESGCRARWQEERLSTTACEPNRGFKHLTDIHFRHIHKPECDSFFEIGIRVHLN